VRRPGISIFTHRGSVGHETFHSRRVLLHAVDNPHGLGGFAQPHNRHSYSVSATPPGRILVSRVTALTPPASLKRARRKIVAASLLGAAAGLTLIISAPRASHAESAGRTSTNAWASAFSVLRQPAIGPLPRAIVSALSHLPASYATEITEARRSASIGAWLIPGSGGLCIAVHDAEGIGASCARGSSAERGELAFQTVASTEKHTIVIGAVPDWIPSVQIRTGTATAASSAAVREKHLCNRRSAHSGLGQSRRRFTRGCAVKALGRRARPTTRRRAHRARCRPMPSKRQRLPAGGTAAATARPVGARCPQTRCASDGTA
jgi:hypothetical protein